MLGVEIEFGNNRIRLETSSYKPTKAETPARWQGFQNSVVARGGIDRGLRMFNPSFGFLLVMIQKRAPLLMKLIFSVNSSSSSHFA